MAPGMRYWDVGDVAVGKAVNAGVGAYLVLAAVTAEPDASGVSHLGPRFPLQL